MMKIKFDELEERAAALKPAPAEPGAPGGIRKGRTGAPTFEAAPNDSHVTIAMPRSYALTDEALADYPDLMHYVKERGDLQFHVVHLGCSLDPDSEEPFERVDLKATLIGPKGQTKLPVVWSMTPLEATKEWKYTKEASLGAKLTFGPLEVEAGGGGGVEIPIEEMFIQGLGEGTSRPYWVLRDVPQRELSGTFRMSMVVESPRETRVEGQVTLEVTVRRKGSWWRTYEAQLPDQHGPTFSLTPPLKQ